jgi:hypothetical protein
VRIGAHDIPVVVGGVSAGHFGEFGADRRGDLRIWLRKGLSKRQKALTLLHESLHAVSEVYGLRWGEREVRAVEQTLGAMIRDNPALFEALKVSERKI